MGKGKSIVPFGDASFEELVDIYTEQAEKLILDLLADRKELASEDIVKAAAEAGISERTVKNARRNLDTRIEVIRRGNQWYYRRNEAKSAK